MSIWKDLSRAKDILSHGGIVGFPTETVYGLGASIQSDSAIKKIFAIKQRPFFDPLIVHICDYAQIDDIAAQWSPTEQKLAEIFWPGPLTIVTRKRSHLNPMITAGLDTVGIRMPSHAVARRLLREFGTPLAAPSANKFGKTSPTRWDHVKSEFPKEDLFVLRGGESEVGIESTVIQIFEDAQKIDVQILRPGILTKSDLEKALRDLGTKSFSVHLKSSSASPGSTETHYQP